MSIGTADTGTTLDDSFGGDTISIDIGSANDSDAEPAAQEAAAEPEAPAVEEPAAPEAEVAPAAAPVAPPPSPPLPSSAQATPPPEPPPWFAQTMAPIQRYFDEQRELIKAGVERRTVMERAASQKAANDARLAAREASRPVAPNPNTATVADLNDYANNLARWHANAAKEDAEIGVRDEVAALRSKLDEITEFNRQSVLDSQSRANEAYISNSVEAFAQDARYPFMKTAQGQDLFLGQWWAMNNAAGKFVPAQEAMARFVGMVNSLTSPGTVAATARAGQEAVDQSRRNQQAKLGVPPAPKAGAPSTKDNSGGDIGDKPWWQSGALH